MEKKRRIGVSGYLIILLLIACVYYLISGIRNGSSISYSEMRQLFEQEKVESFTIDNTRLTMTLKV